MSLASGIFNVRIYGLLINEQQEILIAEEFRYNTFIRKFPGGGLVFGESPIEAVKREFREELSIEIDIIRHFYTTDFFVQSAFNAQQQVISIYYLVKTNDVINEKYFRLKNLNELKEGDEQFINIALSELIPDYFTFPIEKKVCELLLSEFT